MKGPGYKLGNDVRRTWRCPACNRERKLMGDVTTLTCYCTPEGTFMAIVSERTVAPRPYQSLHEHEVRSSEFGIDDMPVLQPHPSSLPPERTGPRRPRPDGTGSEPTIKPPAEVAKVEPAAKAIVEQALKVAPPAPETNIPPEPPIVVKAEEPADEWGEGIL
jgi:hypothetical protein